MASHNKEELVDALAGLNFDDTEFSLYFLASMSVTNPALGLC